MKSLTTDRGRRGSQRAGRLGSLPYLFGVILVLTTAARLSNYLSRRDFLQSQAQTELWQADTARLQDLEWQLTNVETAQRGYLLTGQQQYLDPYRAAIPQVINRIDQLQAMVAAGRLSASDAARLKDLTSRKLAEMEQAISLQQTQGSVAAQALVRAGQGKQEMDEIRQLLGTISAQDQVKLAQTTESMLKAEAWRTDIFLWTGLVNVPFLLWAMWRIWRETGRRADLMDELAAQKELLAVTLGSIGDGVIVTDTEGRITFFNAAAEQLTGWSSAEARGQLCSTVFKIVSEETRQTVPSPVDKVLSLGAVVGLANHTILLRRDGGETPIDDSGAPVLDADGVIRGVVLVFRDFTRHKRAEQNLIRAAAELESAGKAKDQFLAALSHELRTPLTPLLVMLSMWEQDDQLPAELRDDVRMMRRNVQTEARLIDDLLDLTRIAKGKLLLNQENVDLHGLVNSVIARFEMQMSAKSLNVRRTFGAARHFVRADPIRMEQVFWNILQNAIKFTPPGGTISIATRNDWEGWIETEISDDGTGMDPAMLQRLFKPFEQASDESVRRHGGLGMGLAIAHAVMQLHGGQVAGFSEGPGKGSKFTIRMPTAEAPSKSPRRMIPSERKRDSAPLRVLLVEDHLDTAESISRLLEKSGYRVGMAGDVASALKQLGNESWDVLVSDLGLPDASGYELMKEVRERYGLSVRGIAVSGYGMESDRQRSHQAGFDDHIVKPIDFEQLDRAIRKICMPEELGQNV